MLPPVVEIYVVWHPDDRDGQRFADELVHHFHGNRFTGLIGGAVEVYVRTTPWQSGSAAPRPIPFPGTPGPNGIPTARFVVVVPILGVALARSVQFRTGDWYGYCQHIIGAQTAQPASVAVYPMYADEIPDAGVLSGLFDMQGIGRPAGGDIPTAADRCRDLTQMIAQFADDDPSNGRLKVFISHTMRASVEEERTVDELIKRVRSIIGVTKLGEFFAPHDILPGHDWYQRLIDSAATSAMLVLRTDVYSSRVWCQKEVLAAKRAGMPIVSLDALRAGDDRGSFLLDHIPRVPVRSGTAERDEDIHRGLTVLVDECLKRVLWRRQQELARDYGEIDVSWWAPHAPEPATLTNWLTGSVIERDDPLRILHPDPPLGPDEITVLAEVTRLAGITAAPDFLTPKSLSARGV